MAYTSNNATESVNVNTLFLQFYLEIQKEMTTTFASKDISRFNLYAYFLRSCITRSAIRNKIDEAMNTKRKELENDTTIDDVTKQFYTAFIVVEKCMDYLDHTLHITEHDAAAMIDSTDANIKIQLDKLALYKLASQLKSDKVRNEIETKILTQDISDVDQLVAEIAGRQLTDADFKDTLFKTTKEKLGIGISEDMVESQDIGADIPDIEYDAGE